MIQSEIPNENFQQSHFKKAYVVNYDSGSTYINK